MSAPLPHPRLLALAGLAAAVLAGAVPAASSAATPCTSVAARDGSDANPGTELAPFRTAQKLIDSLQPGDSGCLRGGIYTDTDQGYAAHFDRAGTVERPITLRSFPGERAQLEGIVVVRRGADAVHLSGLNLVGTGEMNAVKVYAADTVIEDSDITNEHRANSCLILGSTSAGTAARVLVRRNVLHACGSPANGNKDHAIYASNTRDGQIVDNVITDPAAWAIQFYPNTNGTTFAHNIVNGGTGIRGGVVFGGDADTASSGNVVEQNVIANAATYGVAASWSGATGTGNLARRNCFFENKLGDAAAPEGFEAIDNAVADPGFIDPEHLDFRLDPASPCLALVGYDPAAKIRAAQELAGTPPSESGEISATAFFASGGSTLGGFPGVSLKHPRRLDGGRLLVRARTRRGVAKVLFLVDDKLRATDTRPPYRTTLARVGRRARHVTARAYNSVGRAASASVRLRRR